MNPLSFLTPLSIGLGTSGDGKPNKGASVAETKTYNGQTVVIGPDALTYKIFSDTFVDFSVSVTRETVVALRLSELNIAYTVIK